MQGIYKVVWCVLIHSRPRVPVGWLCFESDYDRRQILEVFGRASCYTARYGPKAQGFQSRCGARGVHHARADNQGNTAQAEQAFLLIQTQRDGDAAQLNIEVEDSISAARQELGRMTESVGGEDRSTLERAAEYLEEG